MQAPWWAPQWHPTCLWGSRWLYDPEGQRLYVDLFDECLAQTMMGQCALVNTWAGLLSLSQSILKQAPSFLSPFLMIRGGTCDACDTPEFGSMVIKQTFLPSHSCSSLFSAPYHVSSCSSWDVDKWVCTETPPVPLSAEFWGTWTFCSSRERTYDDLLGETKGLIQWVGERWVSLLSVIREDLVSWKLSGCECTFFAWFMSLGDFLDAQWTRGPFAREVSSCHPKIYFGEEQKPRDQATFAIILWVWSIYLEGPIWLVLGNFTFCHWNEAGENFLLIFSGHLKFSLPF